SSGAGLPAVAVDPAAAAATQAAEHPGVLEADRPGGGLDRRAVPDQVLGPLQPQDLLVAQRRQASRGGKTPSQGPLANPAGAREVGQAQGIGESGLDMVL